MKRKNNIFEPMLAVKADLNEVRFPVIIQPKLDGIRCVIKDGKPMTRQLKSIPNHFIREYLKDSGDFDGEIMIPGKGFNDVQSAVMSEDGTPNFIFYVFDSFSEPDKKFIERYDSMELPRSPMFYKVPIKRAENVEDIYQTLEDYINEGYEGLILRDPDGYYKYGRSTINEGLLLKVKRFFDDEAILVDIIEKMNNTNPKEKNERGKTKRSSKKDGKIPAGTSGTFIADWNGKLIKLGFGEGITDEHKQTFWNNKEEYLGKKLTFRYQELSPDNVPRFGKFVGFRYDL